MWGRILTSTTRFARVEFERRDRDARPRRRVDRSQPTIERLTSRASRARLAQDEDIGRERVVRRSRRRAMPTTKRCVICSRARLTTTTTTTTRSQALGVALGRKGRRGRARKRVLRKQIVSTGTLAMGGAQKPRRLLRREHSARVARLVASHQRRTGSSERDDADLRRRVAVLRRREIERGDVLTEGALSPSASVRRGRDAELGQVPTVVTAVSRFVRL